jgi:hypothetical protein
MVTELLGKTNSKINLFVIFCLVVYSYTEFLFAMAEGSPALREISSSVQNLADAPPLLQKYSFLPFNRGGNTTPRKLTAASRRQVTEAVIFFSVFLTFFVCFRVMEMFCSLHIPSD